MPSSPGISLGLVATVTAVGLTTIPFVLPFLRTKPPRRMVKQKAEFARTASIRSGFEVLFIPGPDGLKLEVLTNVNHTEPSNLAPVLFVHGGMGTARCYDNWTEYLGNKGRVVYALSLRGHGQSDRPRNFSRSTKADFARDIVAAVEYIHSTGTPAPVLVGHSAGGGLSQYACSSGLLGSSANTQISGLFLVAAYPPTGGFPVFVNWGIFDPLFMLRHMLQLGDPNSPLSSPDLVKRAFFWDGTNCDMRKFFRQVNSEESMGWPYSMMFSIADAEKVKKAVPFSRVHIIAGSQDRLMSLNIMEKMRANYNRNPAPGASAVLMDVVRPSGHHVMWDDSWLQGIQALEKRLEEWGL